MKLINILRSMWGRSKAKMVIAIKFWIIKSKNRYLYYWQFQTRTCKLKQQTLKFWKKRIKNPLIFLPNSWINKSTWQNKRKTMHYVAIWNGLEQDNFLRTRKSRNKKNTQHSTWIKLTNILKIKMALCLLLKKSWGQSTTICWISQ